MEKGSLFPHELLPFGCPVDTRNKSDHPLSALAFPTFPLPRCSPGWTRTLPVMAFQFLGLKVVPPGPIAPVFNPEKTLLHGKRGCQSFQLLLPRSIKLPKDNSGRGECEPVFIDKPSYWTTRMMPHGLTRWMSVSIRHPSLIRVQGGEVGYRSRNRSIMRMEAFSR